MRRAGRAERAAAAPLGEAHADAVRAEVGAAAGGAAALRLRGDRGVDRRQRGGRGEDLVAWIQKRDVGTIQPTQRFTSSDNCDSVAISLRIPGIGRICAENPSRTQRKPLLLN